jgi:mannosyltransferase OCH1-like enzyme
MRNDVCDPHKFMNKEYDKVLFAVFTGLALPVLLSSAQTLIQPQLLIEKT